MTIAAEAPGVSVGVLGVLGLRVVVRNAKADVLRAGLGRDLV